MAPEHGNAQLKAAPFEYVRPETLADAIALLAQDEDARPIAGGQTLVPMMAMRLARPTKLVDIARLPELGGMRSDNGFVVIGAGVRQADVEHSPDTAINLPLLAAALPWVGHQPTRNRGTIGGSVANADPAAEIPLALVALDGAVMVTGAGGENRIRAGEFFVGPMMTAVAHGALVTATYWPVWRGGAVGVGFHEISARRSDFAYVSAAAQVMLDGAGNCQRCAVGIGGASPAPTRLAGACAALEGSRLSDAEIEAALDADVAGLEIMSDGHATPAYRRRVARALALRALRDARDDARKKGGGKA